jgi:hypothetical protein
MEFRLSQSLPWTFLSHDGISAITECQGVRPGRSARGLPKRL